MKEKNKKERRRPLWFWNERKEIKDERHRKHDQHYIHSECFFFVFFPDFYDFCARDKNTHTKKSAICKLDFETKSLKLRNLSKFQIGRNTKIFLPPVQIFHVSFVFWCFFFCLCNAWNVISLKKYFKTERSPSRTWCTLRNRNFLNFYFEDGSSNDLKIKKYVLLPFQYDTFFKKY